jgi:hypothetical protein
MSATSNLRPEFTHPFYLFRRKVFKIFGGAFHVYDETGNVVLYSKQLAFKLKEDFRIYSDERQTTELLRIKTPHIVDIAARYDVEDSTSGEAVGAIRRTFFRSLMRDQWLFLSPDGQEIGKLKESSLLGALLSRWINLVPQHYVAETTYEAPVAEIDQHFNPFVLKYDMRIADANPPIDRRLLIAAGILLAAIERRQD